MSEIALKMEKISKSFGGVHALVEVDFTAYAGKVNVLMGENGAGKSTLMKVLAGAISKDAGEIYIGGGQIEIGSPQDSLDHKIAMIYQEFNLVRDMTVEENIYLGKEFVSKGLLNKKLLMERTRELLKEYNIHIDPRATVADLSVAEQQMLEIAKALSMDARMIVMDEPTSSLTNREVDNLFHIIKRLTGEGITIIYISHRMEEIFEIGDYITVMRDGALVGEWPVSEVDQQKLISYMVGREITNLYPKEDVPIGDKVLEVHNLTKQGVYRDISFDVHRGEILGMSGLVGAGRTEVALSIFGAMHFDSGQILLNGKEVKIRMPDEAMKLRIAYVPEDRKNLALDLSAKISDNISLANMNKVSKNGFLRFAEERSLVNRMVEQLRIKTPSIYQLAGNLSGGNQQKVVLAKWLARELDVLILDEPTRGIDVGSKEEIHKLIVELAKQGLGIILISSELPEVLGMSDRIVVMYEGNLKAILSAEEASQESIMSYSVDAQIIN